MNINIMLVDDDRLVREGIKSLLDSEKNLKVIEQAGNGIECLEKLRIVRPNLLILDISMPKMSGFEVLKRIRKKNSNLKILILTSHKETEYLKEAFNLGANGYILKSVDFHEFKFAILSIMNNNSYIQPELLPLLSQNHVPKNNERERAENLTRREIEVLKQISKGMLNKEIADNLNISERTVKNHISNIFKKLDVSDRTQAAVFAIKNNIVDEY